VIPTSQDRKRLVLVALFVFFLFTLLIAQYYKIQIVEGEKWSRAAKKQHQLVVVEPFKRGLFYSNTSIKKGHPEKPQPFVVDVPKFHLYADPDAIPEKCRSDVVVSLAKLLNLRPEDSVKLKAQLDKKSRSRKLVMWLKPEMQEAVNQWWLPFAKAKKIPRNALFFIQDYKRSYPFGKLLGQVLHTLREDKDDATHQSIPTGGLEAAFNNHLKGKEGKRVILRSPRNPLDTGKVVVKPEHGADVYLTINHCLQAIAEEEIAKAVVNANAKGGWAIMMDPKTGEILALAQYPWFAPASYRDFFNDPKLEEHTKVKALIDPFEPGSTMKPITLAIALKANKELKKQGKHPIFSPHEKVATGIGHFPGRGKPLKDLRTHRFLNMYMGLQKSSNVYMAKMVQRVLDTLGDDWYRAALKEIFGFGVKTNIELSGESAGLLPMPGKKHPNGTLEWSKATPYSLAMGHNILANSLQMLRCYGIFANGGIEVQPTLIRKIVKTDSEGKQTVILDNTKSERTQSFRRVLEPEIVSEVVTAMRYVMKPGGSAARGDIPGYTAAGKTGSSEKVVNGVYSKKNHISSFIGFAPVKDPKFVLVVVIDEPEHKYIPGVGKNHLGGGCCAPGFREIGLRALQYLGVPPDDPDKKEWMDNVASLKKLYMEWNQ
jgi:cell division protein FtsI (penicillin-binding protein 3)